LGSVRAHATIPNDQGHGVGAGVPITMTGIALRTCIPIPKVPVLGRPRSYARTRIGEANLPAPAGVCHAYRKAGCGLGIHYIGLGGAIPTPHAIGNHQLNGIRTGGR
jgi:hypothetical protein